MKYLPMVVKGANGGISTTPVIITSSRHDKAIGDASNIVLSPVKNSIAFTYKR